MKVWEIVSQIVFILFAYLFLQYLACLAYFRSCLKLKESAISFAKKLTRHLFILSIIFSDSHL